MKRHLRHHLLVVPVSNMYCRQTATALPQLSVQNHQDPPFSHFLDTPLISIRFIFKILFICSHKNGMLSQAQNYGAKTHYTQ